MKITKKILALLLALVIAVTMFAACSDNKSGVGSKDKKDDAVADLTNVDVKDLGMKSVGALEKIKSVHISQTVDMSATLGHMDAEINVNMESDVDVAGNKMHSKGTANSNGLSIDMEMYIEEDGNDASVYVNANNSSWMKQSIPVSMLKADPSYNDYYESAVFLMNALQGANKSDTTHMGKAAIKVTGVLDTEDPEGIMKSSGISTSGTTGITTAQFQQMLTGLAPVQITAYIEKSTGLPLQIDMDMTDFMNSLYVNLGKISPSGQSVAATVHHAKASMIFTDYNNTSADVPNDVKDAINGGTPAPTVETFGVPENNEVRIETGSDDVFSPKGYKSVVPEYESRKAIEEARKKVEKKMKEMQENG